MAIPKDRLLRPQSDAERVAAAVARFGSELGPRMRGDGRREDQLRSPVQTLLKELAKVTGRKVVIHEEVTLADGTARPDLAIDVPSGRVGYVELKAPDKGIPDKNWRPTKHDRDQLKNLSALPNLIYTNGKYWGLYRKGSLVGRVGALEGDLASSGSRLAPVDGELERLFREFLAWKPDRPTTLRGVVAEVAPLCRLLREQVTETMTYERSTPSTRDRHLTRLANEWRSILFPNLTEEEFADAYAQAVTFSLLLARIDGISFDNRSLTNIATQLGKQHLLMGEALLILTNPRWVKNLSILETLRGVVGNIDWDDVQLGETGAYTILYETFLAEYDPKLRRRSGTYYTPDSIARAMVAFADQVLKTRLGKPRGFAADDVVVVDPAMGTGTFLVEIIESVVATLSQERGSDAIPEAHLRELFARRLVGFELQVAPYAVAELRIGHVLKGRYGVDLPPEEVRFLSNTLDDPDKLSFDFGQFYDVLKESREAANRIKRAQPVMVVIGNPPWRERARGEAPWLERPRKGQLPPDTRQRPSLDEFRAPGQGTRAFNLSNMWTFFWRWAIWKAFEANPEYPAGIVVLISPKAYITSESHAGMRRYLRETADEGWIVDLSPEGFRPDVPSRVFPTVQQPICIGVFARYGAGDRHTPAKVHHTAVHGEQGDKFLGLADISPQGQAWADAPSGWDSPFQPSSTAWGSYPRLSDLFPWQQTGVNSNRNWVWAPDVETLRRRWSTLVHASQEQKGRLFKETRDRSIDRPVPALSDVPSGDVALQDEYGVDPPIARVSYRSFDRQYLINDRRVIDFPRPDLWRSQGPRQIFVSEQHSVPITGGTALTFTAMPPNVNHFNGRGGRVLPLFRDRGANNANVLPGLLEVLSIVCGELTPEDLLAYTAALVAHPGYTHRFLAELATPGIRVPLTRDPGIWRDAVGIGREVLWLHTFGQRCVDESAGRPPSTPQLSDDQRPRPTRPISASEEEMPDRFAYWPATQTLVIGTDGAPERDGSIDRVSPQVWEYSAGGGVPVVRRWFSYRLRNPRHKRQTSGLDQINPERWTAEFDDELLALLNVLGRCVALEPRQADLLDRVCAGPLITLADLEREAVLPVPDGSRKPPPLTGRYGPPTLDGQA